MSLYEQIIGHEQIIDQLKHAIANDKVNHAYIITGADGAGKNMVAKAFAQALLCEGKGVCGCGVCHSCKQIASSNNPDLRYVIPEKPNVITVDEVREQLVDDIQIKPYQGSYKIYIMDDAQLMNPSAQNAILKTIEEPPSYGVVLLLTNNVEMLLPTIRSRCITYELRPLRESVITEYLISNVHIPDYEARMCASFSQGYLGRAMQLATSEDFAAMREDAMELVRNVYTWEVADLIDEVKKIATRKLTMGDFLDLLAVWYRDALMFKVTRDPNRVIFSDEINQIRKQSTHSSYEGLENILKALETAKQRLAANVNFDLAIELLLLNIKEN